MTDVQTCAALQEQLTALMDEELSEASAAKVQVHLDTCPDCARRFAEMNRLRHEVHTWQIPEMDIADAVMEKIQRETGTQRKMERLVARASDKAVAEARAVQQKTGGELGEILIKLGHFTETDLFQAQAEAENLPFIDLTKHRAEPSAIVRLPGLLARQYQALPVKKDGQMLYVAMRDPRDAAAVEAIRQASRISVIRPMLAVPAEIEKALQAAYGPQQSELPKSEMPKVESAEPLLNVLLTELRALRGEMQSARDEIAGLKAEVSALRQRVSPPTATVSRYVESPQLMPYAPPSNLPSPLG